MTRVAAGPRALRVGVGSPPTRLDTFDYADAFAVDLPASGERTAEQWARVALEDAPAAFRLTVLVAWRALLGLRLGPRRSPQHVLGWRIVESRPGTVVLQATSVVLGGTIVGRLDGGRMTVTTFVTHRVPLVSRPLWVAVGPLHRRIAPRLLEDAVSR